MKATKARKEGRITVMQRTTHVRSTFHRYSLDKTPIERNVFTRVMSNRILRIEGKKIPAIMNLGVRG